MRFLIDENLPEILAQSAREKGHKSVWIRNIHPGLPDDEILTRLRSTGEILVTRDIRFANLVLALKTAGEKKLGVVLIREQKMELVQKVWNNFLSKPISFQGIVVIKEQRIRLLKIEDN